MLRPEKTFFQLIEQKGLPSRIRRFCCEKLKEYKIKEKAILGVRKAESDNRARLYDEPTKCLYYGRAKKPENHVEGIYPILDWTDEDVLNYIEANNIRLHPLYYREDGTIDIKRRLGCMCCPMIYWKRRAVEFRQHPVMVRAYCRAAQKHREAHPDADAAKKYTDVYQLFFRNMFFDTQEKWEQWLADNNASAFGITDYRQFLMDYFKVDLPEVK
jgi:phosphoadenosine phosphosulfate reductase